MTCPSGGVALDATTGALLWENATDAQMSDLHDPVFLKGSLLSGANYLEFGQILRVSTKTGEIHGSEPAGGVQSLAVADGELAYSTYTYSIPSFISHAVRWKYSVGVDFTSDHMELAPSADFAILGDRILWNSGAVVWQTNVNPLVAKASVAGDIVLVTTIDNRVVAIDSSITGVPVWEGVIPEAGGRPLIAGSVVFVPSGKNISAHNLAGCGEPRCPVLTLEAAGAPITGGPIVDDGRLIFGTADGRIVAYGLPAEEWRSGIC